MKILYVTHFTPTIDNYNGPSALMYHLLNSREKNDTLLVYSTNQNRVPKDLLFATEKQISAKINLIEKTIIQKIETSNKVAKLLSLYIKEQLPADSKYRLSKNTISRIKEYQPDVIFLYPHTMINVARQLIDFKLIVCGPDCASLHYSRALRDSFIFKQNKTEITVKQYLSRIRMEKEWATIKNAKLYMVGYADTHYFNTINNNKQAAFFPHPHYKLGHKEIDLSKERIRVLISGKYDIYTYTDFTILLNALKDNPNENLRKKLTFVFMGKDWGHSIEALRAYGYKVEQQGWVKDYVKFISTCDIQIFPISVGSGTKGKVLDALSTGLLCIGSEYAFENIAIEPNKDCIVYYNPGETISIINKILDNRELYTKMAKNGRNKVRTFHNPKNIFNAIINWRMYDDIYINSNKYYTIPK